MTFQMKKRKKMIIAVRKMKLEIITHIAAAFTSFFVLFLTNNMYSVINVNTFEE